MANDDMFYDPNMVTLVLTSESVSDTFLEHNPYVQYKKGLTGGFTIVYVRQADVGKVISNIENYAKNLYPLVLGLVGTQELNAAGILQVQQQPYLGLMGSGVLLGLIDTGIDYTQSVFRYEDGGSKIFSIWDQSERSGHPPEGFPYGSEYTMAQLNEALASEDPLKVVPHVDKVGHGTFLASVVGSRDQTGQYIGAAPDAEIIAVKLRGARPVDRARFLIPPEQENAYSSDDFMMGIEYIVDKALMLRRPVAICVSVGTNTGPHDGFLVLGSYLQRISGVVGVAVCASAGNEGQAGHHTYGKLAAVGDSQNIEMRVGPGLEDIYLSIWNSSTDRISVSVTSPTGENVARVPARSGTTHSSKLILERATVIIEYLFPIERSGAQFTRIKILSATPGIWTITVYADMVLDGMYHAWLPLTGFISPETVFLTPSPSFTIVTPGDSIGVITCGAYNSRDNSFAAFSSQGPSRMNTILPDLVAPGVDVSGIYPGGVPGTMSGTSAAAAITAGACALLLQWGIVEENDRSIDSYRIRANLIAGCSRDPNVDYPNNQWGYGKLNLYNTFRALRPY